jgi:polysaccharide biosynthesis protein PslH
MKVLQVSNKIPYPEKDGGAIAINAITEGLLKADCSVKMLAMNTKKHFINVASIPEKFRNDRQLETVTIDTSIKPLAALIALLTGKSYNISRFQSADFSKKLAEILQKEKFDIIQLEGLYLTPYIPVIKENTKAPIILRAHNIEWKIWQKLASEEKNIFKKWYLTILSKQLRKYEEKAVKLIDGIATITKGDLSYLKETGCRTPMVTIPFGIDVAKYTVKESKDDNSLFYIGALDWLPNLQGLDWFLKNVWARILIKHPNTQFHIAGRNMPYDLRNNAYPNVVIHGEVENAKTFMEDYDIMLVPLLAGSGVRVKIIEGMAMGKPIITTGIGIEGIECNMGQDVLIANTPEQFAEAACKCLADKKLKQSLGQNARKFVEENNDIGKATSLLMGFYKERILQRQ